VSPGCTLTWLGHSTVLVELGGVRLITDPLLRQRVFLLRRKAPPVRPVAKVDAVLVSHVHWDHLDLPSLARLEPRALVIAPRGAGRILRRRGHEVMEVVAGDHISVGDVEVLATHAEHDLGRSWRRVDAPALGFVMSGPRRIYFAGDTDLFDQMAELADGLDVALMPVGGWGPSVPAGHLDPRRAAAALRLLQPRKAVPIHWGTYGPIGLRLRPGANPAEEFRRHAAEVAPRVDVQILSPGETCAC
jgi:L-ascorbate metabolism protein UlaG (beta-lactamase superfamily)